MSGRRVAIAPLIPERAIATPPMAVLAAYAAFARTPGNRVRSSRTATNNRTAAMRVTRSDPRVHSWSIARVPVAAGCGEAPALFCSVPWECPWLCAS